jgi:hypothetical protein
MKRVILLLVAGCYLALASFALAGDVHQYKVRYSLHGLGQSMIVSTQSPSDARETVKALVPEAVVYQASQVR